MSPYSHCVSCWTLGKANKSVVKDMKGKFGSVSRRGRLGYEMISRSQQSCWVHLPPELLREVLMRIEASEDTWLPRRNVVTCAGVCKNWREIMKELVKSPEVSGKLTFPISLKQPGPKDSIFQCYIKRSRTMLNHTYYLYLSLNDASTDNGKFLLAAKKCRRATCTDYIISSNPKDVSEANSAFVGKLRSNFLGNTFTVYDSQPADTECRSTKVPAGNNSVAHIAYELHVMGSNVSRRLQCVMDAIPASAVKPAQIEFVDINLNSMPSLPIFRSKPGQESEQCQNEGMLVLKNKAPRWHEQLQCWCLNFNERVTGGSVMNFQLVASPEEGITDDAENENVILEFGKVGEDLYTMDYQYPISAFQAFAICLSSFDTNIACE
ncbi:tubby-like F-box protein 3 [Argentina anserina]|uniref:tubby-like F-box protein 3 n=1 Tax=Argentina anserina TaxID=57926 RepID=UPI0021764A62|nr:tubby-like F-box protein 3 [Potentilla anserina]